MRQRLAGVLCVVSAFVVLASCSGGGPNTPGPTPTSITVTSLGPNLLIGVAETFTATLVMSNGTTQTLTGGTWGSDTPGVATVNASTGAATGVARGDVSIFVDAQGLRGSKRLTVIPSYTGIWVGTYLVSACTASGGLLLSPNDMCTILPVGSTPPVAFNLTHNPTTVSGLTALGGVLSAGFTGVLATNGALTFTAVATLVTPTGTITVSQAWQVNISATGQLAGTVVQTWSIGGPTPGQGTLSGTLVNVAKSSADQLQSLRSDQVFGSLADVAAAVSRRR